MLFSSIVLKVHIISSVFCRTYLKSPTNSLGHFSKNSFLVESSPIIIFLLKKFFCVKEIVINK